MFTNTLACAFPLSDRLNLPKVATPVWTLTVIADLVVPARDGKDVSSDGPADVPHYVVELVQQLGRPRVARGVITRPDKHTTVLLTQQPQMVHMADLE